MSDHTESSPKCTPTPEDQPRKPGPSLRGKLIRIGGIAAGALTGIAIYAATEHEVSSMDARKELVASCATHLGADATLFARHHLPDSCRPFGAKYQQPEHPGTYRFPSAQAFKQEQVTDFRPIPGTGEGAIYFYFLAGGGALLGGILSQGPSPIEPGGPLAPHHNDQV